MSRQRKQGGKNYSGRGGGRKNTSYARGNAPLKSDGSRKTTGRQHEPRSKYRSNEPEVTKSTQKQDDSIRLNKYIANSGICSRREADTYIAAGLVTVNGEVVNKMGYKVQLSDDVRFDGRRINPEPNTYILLNKPKGFSTTESSSKNMTVMDLIANATTAKVRPLGRLGRNATGLLLFTNDDEFVQKFSKKGMSRLFHIELNKNLKLEDLKKIRSGLLIDGEKVEIEEVDYVQGASKNEVGLKIKHTGNSIIRKIFNHLDYDVMKVDCVILGPLTKKDLPRGRYRLLTKRELELFSML